MATDRERFLAQVYTMPLLPVDAIVVLAGEDALERGNMALELFKQNVAPVIVCSGARHDPPRRVNGQGIATDLLARGIAPDRVLVENGSNNTAEQARNVIDLAVVNDWHRLLIVASNYHLPRAFLTFVKAIGERGIRLTGVSTTHLFWHHAPPGMRTHRVDLFHGELDKCETHTDDIATWAEGLDYLKRWEGR